jgi:hypothetical protein
MPYISKEQRQKEKWDQLRAHWMTLVEAINHIRRSEKCSEEDALSQLREAIGDGAVKARWDDLPMYDDDYFLWLEITDIEGLWKHPQVRTPSGSTFWRHIPIRLEGTGSVLDDITNYQPLIWRNDKTATQIAVAVEGEADAIINANIREMQNARIAQGELKFRPLALLRSSLLAVWPLAQETIRPVVGKDESDQDVKSKAPKLGRPTIRKLVEGTLRKMHLEGIDIFGTQARLAEKVAERNKVTLGQRRWKPSTVIRHIRVIQGQLEKEQKVKK